MASLAKIFGGILLIVAGIAIIYESGLHHLIEIITIFGVILVIIGAYLLILSFFERNNSTTLQNFKKNLDNDHKVKKLDGGFGSKNNSLNKDRNDGKKGSIATLGNNLTSSKLSSIDTKKITDKVKDVSKSTDPKSVLKPMLPKANENIKKFKFTPNYEKPMKVNRRPQKRNKSDLSNISNINNGNNIVNRQNNGIDNLNNLNNLPGEKSERIARALASDDFIKPVHNESKATLSPNVRNNRNITQNNLLDDEESRDFTIDDLEDKNINNNGLGSGEISPLDGSEPSKFLSSYVVCSKGTMTSKEAFDELAKSARSEISLEMTSIKDMTDEFLSKISSLDVKIIIQEFDIKDMAYILLITSLIEQGVKIRTLPIINTINLIADDSHALIISANDSPDDLDIGAVYNDSKSISNVKSMFENSWNIASELDINNIGKGFG